MVKLNAHFDGKTIVLDEPFSLPVPSGTRLKLTIEPVEETQPSRTAHAPKAGSAKGKVAIAPDFDAPLDDFAEYMK